MQVRVCLFVDTLSWTVTMTCCSSGQKSGRHQYPILSQVAAIYLLMSASSVPVECMFSTTGIILISKRCMLSDDKLHRMSFVHDNIKFVL